MFFANNSSSNWQAQEGIIDKWPVSPARMMTAFWALCPEHQCKRQKIRGNRESTGGWNVPITMCLCTTAFQCAFTYLTSLHCNKFGLRVAGPILPRKDPKSRLLTLRKWCRKQAGATFSFSWCPVFIFLCESLAPLGWQEGSLSRSLSCDLCSMKTARCPVAPSCLRLLKNLERLPFYDLYF